MSDSGHILTQFDDALKSLGADVAGLKPVLVGGLEAVERALMAGDVRGLQDVREEAASIERSVADVENAGRLILVRFRPVATDLRYVLARVRVCSVAMELAEELAELAKRALALVEANEAGEPDVLAEMQRVRPLFDMAVNELRDGLDALEGPDVDLAASVRRRDAELDQLHAQLISDFIDSLSSDGRGKAHSARWLVDAVFLVRSIERVGDLAKNIADEVVFVATAKADYHAG
ncbi:phosphate signaling complex PhoU family protein [Sulfuriroseicoccus oceanibius]|uniref:PhoU domain-containing protein n=1 Tax=Sulfuriroseicoccus oceanibius TaxID=2707525 RepID=A0A6B3L482_9BACT|nr:PhoU domain-containing protein [Sulfuriroseicoccus oceanibius]QQL46264.1 hypothetical protein G3M56_006730 [Sulfuriroseicoccus oceanibius]